MKHTSYLDGIRPPARFRWSLVMLAPRFEVQSVCFMIYGFLTLERPCREASLKLHSFKGIESFKKQNRNWRRRTAYRHRIAKRTFNEYIWYPRVFFPLDHELEVRAWLLVTDRVFMSMTKQPEHKPTGKEAADHNFKKWARTLFPGGLPYEGDGDTRRRICNLHRKARRRASPSRLYGSPPPNSSDTSPRKGRGGKGNFYLARRLYTALEKGPQKLTNHSA